MEFTYDDSNLIKLFMALDEKKRVSALKGGFRKVANDIKKRAIANLRTSGLHYDRGGDMEKGVRGLPFKIKTGLKVTIGPKKANKNGKGEKGMHVNRQGKSKPVLLWADGGTKPRTTKGRKGFRLFRRSSGRYTGAMPRYDFMSKTMAQVGPDVSEQIHKMVTEMIIKKSKDCGCK